MLARPWTLNELLLLKKNILDSLGRPLKTSAVILSVKNMKRMRKGTESKINRVISPLNKSRICLHLEH